jgi:hypothetical protein
MSRVAYVDGRYLPHRSAADAALRIVAREYYLGDAAPVP